MRRAVLGVAVALCIGIAGCAHSRDNFRVVKEDAFYRSGQMDADALREAIETHDIKTVVNLRQVEDDDRWHANEKAVCESVGISHFDLEWSSVSPPEPDSLDDYLSILETAPRPILVHCRMGTHRAGTASAIYLLTEGEDIEAAKDQFTLLFLGAPVGDVVEWYKDDQSTPFPTWAREKYPEVYEEHLAD